MGRCGDVVNCSRKDHRNSLEVSSMPEIDSSCWKTGLVDPPPRRVFLSWLKVKVTLSESGKGARGWRAGADMAVSPDRDLDETGGEKGSRRGRSRGYR